MKARLFLSLLTIVLLSQATIFPQLPAPTNLTATEINWMHHPAVKLEWQGSNNTMEKFNV